MYLYRLHRPLQDAFDTTGAFLSGGRWHLAGSRVIYSSQHISLAVLETLVYAGPGKMPARAVTRIFVPDECPVEYAGWLERPYSQSFGEVWLKESRSVILAVPSIVVNKLESNYVLNPAHPDFRQITHGASEEFVFDDRFEARRAR